MGERFQEAISAGNCSVTHLQILSYGMGELYQRCYYLHERTHNYLLVLFVDLAIA
jgi:hypothetical protein